MWWVNVIIVCEWLTLVHLYPESGFVVNLENYQSASTTNEWILLKGWQKSYLAKGAFFEGFNIKNDSMFLASRPGLYFASLQIQFQMPVSNALCMTRLAVTANSITKYYETEDRNQSYIKTLFSNWIVLIDENASFQLYVLSSAAVSYSSKSSFTMQLICSYTHSLGFVALPKQFEVLPGVEKQLVANWETLLDVGNGFSKSTGNFIIEIDGFYLISLNLILLNASGEMSVYLSDSNAGEEVVHRSHSVSKISKTIAFTAIKKYFSKTKLVLKVNVENGCRVSSKSQYSVVFIESISWKYQSYDVFYLMSEEVVNNTGELVKITNWQINLDFVYFNGAFQIASTGYYFIILSLNMVIKGKAFIKIGFSLNGEEKSSLSIYPSNNSNIVSISNVLFIMQKEALSCHIQTSSNVNILPLSYLIIFKVPFALYNSLYTINTGNISVDQDSRFRYLQFKKAPVGHHSKVVLSTDKRGLKVLQDGIFYIVISFFSEKLFTNKLFNFSLVNKNHNVEQTISRCVQEDLSACFSPVILLLKSSDSLAVLQECFAPSYCFEDEVSLSFEIQYINRIEEAIGLSLKVDNSVKLEKNDYVLTYEQLNQNSMFFNRSISLYKDRILIDHPGVYIITLNVNIDAGVVVDFFTVSLELHLYSNLKVKKFYSYEAAANSQVLSISIVKIYYLNKHDSLQFLIKHSLNSTYIVKKSYTVSTFMLTNNQTKYALAVISPTYAKSSADVIFTLPKHSKPSKYIRFFYDFVALKTFVAIISVEFHLKLDFLSNSADQFIELHITRKGQNISPHFSSTKKLLNWSSQLTLQLSGVLLFYPDDIIQFNIKASNGISFEVLDGTSVMFGILDGVKENVQCAEYFGFTDLIFSDPMFYNASKVGDKPGIYIIVLRISSSLNQTLTFEIFDEKIVNMWNSMQVQLILSSNDSNVELLQFDCTYCNSIELKFMVHLKGKEIIRTLTNTSLFRIKTYALYSGNEVKNLRRFTYEHNIMLCNLEKIVDVVYGFEYRAFFQGRVLFIANLFMKENRSVLLVIDGNLDKGEPLTTTKLKDDLYVHQLNKKIFLNLYQLMQFFIICNNKNKVTFLKESTVAVYREEEVLFEELHTNIPVFYVQPYTKFFFSPQFSSYACKAYGNQNIEYRWNKVDINSGHQYLNISTSSNLTLSRPSEIGHYFCTASSQGYEVDSNIGTFLIQEEDKCQLMVLTDMEPCSTMADCISVDNSYKCSCKNGYYGDGFNCEDIDECEQENICGKNSICKNLNGTFSCSCNLGFESINGANCQDTDECSLNGDNICIQEMHSNQAFCHNKEGSYECLCKYGFVKENNTCKDVNECSYLDKYVCHKQASCQNISGSNVCKCNLGWTGNGTDCTDINECSETKCAINARCVNNLGSYMCICNQGYEGNGSIECMSVGCPSYCTAQYSVSWLPQKPYIGRDLSLNHVYGLIKDILDLIIKDICRECSHVVYEEPLKSFADLAMIVHSNITDFGCTFYGYNDQFRFSGHPFIPLIERTKVAFYIKIKKDKYFMQILSQFCLVPVILFLLVLLFGMIIWFVDTLMSSRNFSGSFFKGSYQSFCWVVALLTNIGFVKKVSQTFFAQTLGIMWMLSSVLLISVLTACVTIIMLPKRNTMNLHGLKVGAISNSEEFRLGFKRNAEVVGYSSVADIIEALTIGEIDGALLDTLIARDFQKDLLNYKFQEMIEHDFAYGLVLARDGLKLETMFMNFLKYQPNAIYSVLSNGAPVEEEIKVSRSNTPEESIVFNFKSLLYYQLLLLCVAFIVVSIMVGFFFERFLWRKKPPSSTTKIKFFSRKPRIVWRGYKIIEYQKITFKNEILGLKRQIDCFTRDWNDRLDGMELAHAQQLNRAKNWLNKSKKI